MQQPLEHPAAAAQHAVAPAAGRQAKGPARDDLDAKLDHGARRAYAAGRTSDPARPHVRRALRDRRARSFVRSLCAAARSADKGRDDQRSSTGAAPSCGVAAHHVAHARASSLVAAAAASLCDRRERRRAGDHRVLHRRLASRRADRAGRGRQHVVHGQAGLEGRARSRRWAWSPSSPPASPPAATRSAITAGPDGNMWFVELVARRVGADHARRASSPSFHRRHARRRRHRGRARRPAVVHGHGVRRQRQLPPRDRRDDDRAASSRRTRAGLSANSLPTSIASGAGRQPVVHGRQRSHRPHHDGWHDHRVRPTSAPTPCRTRSRAVPAACGSRSPQASARRPDRRSRRGHGVSRRASRQTAGHRHRRRTGRQPLDHRGAGAQRSRA